jgi:hypothetical protein
MAPGQSVCLDAGSSAMRSSPRRTMFSNANAVCALVTCVCDKRQLPDRVQIESACPNPTPCTSCHPRLRCLPTSHNTNEMQRCSAAQPPSPNSNDAYNTVHIHNTAHQQPSKQLFAILRHTVADGRCHSSRSRLPRPSGEHDHQAEGAPRSLSRVQWACRCSRRRSFTLFRYNGWRN